MNVGLLLGRFLLTHPPKADKSRKRIACIGDSITFGAGIMQTRKTDVWTVLWQKLLGEQFQVLNYGVSGATLQRGGDFPYRKVGFLGRLPEASPEMIVLMLGSNDSKPYNWNWSRFEKEYEELVKELASEPWKPKVVLMVPPKAFPEEKTGVVAFDIDMNPIEAEGTGLKARALCHELEHLDGHLYVEKVEGELLSAEDDEDEEEQGKE